MKVCLVHDDWVQYGGAERLFEEISKIWPKAPIYTSQVDWEKIPKSINKNRIKTSFIQRIPFAKHLYKILLPLYPLAFESFNFEKYDVVISSTTRFAKAIITNPDTIHICYINSIPRFLKNKETLNDYLHPIVRFLLKPYFFWLKRWDSVSANRPDFYIANSQNVASDLKSNYQIKSGIVHPFADTEFFKPGKEKKQDFFLIVSRLVPWKRVDLAIKAANSMNIKAKIVGDGPAKQKLQQLANNKIEFLGNIEKDILRDLYRNAKALIVTQKEDFGISTVEALACGTPVIAYAKGGQTEIITNGETGVFFENQSEKSLQDAISRFSKLKWDKDKCRTSAKRFDKDKFIKKLKGFVENASNKSQ